MTYLEEELGGVIEKLDIGEPERAYLRSRWMGQILWMDKKANRARRRFHLARITVIVGSLAIPPMVMSEQFRKSDGFRWIIIGISLLVAFSGAVEAFLHLGDTWRHYRGNVEVMKSQGWLFSLKSGPYRRYDSQSAAFPAFAERIEDLLQEDVSEYLQSVSENPRQEHGPVVRPG